MNAILVKKIKSYMDYDGLVKDAFSRTFDKIDNYTESMSIVTVYKHSGSFDEFLCFIRDLIKLGKDVCKGINISNNTDDVSIPQYLKMGMHTKLTRCVRKYTLFFMSSLDDFITDAIFEKQRLDRIPLEYSQRRSYTLTLSRINKKNNEIQEKFKAFKREFLTEFQEVVNPFDFTNLFFVVQGKMNKLRRNEISTNS